MNLPPEYSFARYLASKKSVDDRALNRRVWESLSRQLADLDAARPVQILEIGCGIGAMLERMLEWRLLNNAAYTGLDALPENIAVAARRLPEWALAHGCNVESCGPRQWELKDAGRQARAGFVAADLFDFAAIEQEHGRYDLLIAHAFLDLMDIPAALPVLFRLLRPGGLFYFTINFDGATLFDPPIDPALDDQIQALYHRTMDERLTAGKPSGDSRAGRHLFTHLRQAGARLLDAGPSDWVVFPVDGRYAAGEGDFLHFIIQTVHQALAGHAELDPAAFEGWARQRHAQIERGELVYIAHQLDFVGVRL